jgi:hypothetical protein
VGALVSGSWLTDRLLKPFHHHATTTVLAADLLAAAGDREVVGLLGRYAE